jgi:glycosyltransferase involved in cell wall biosynthesis
LVLGGYDVAFLPELGYGSYKNKFRAYLTTFSIRFATHVLPVADNLEVEARQRVPRASIDVVYTGYDDQKFCHDGTQKKAQIITVAVGNSIQRIKLKGIDFFIKLADELPGYDFIIVGLGEQARIALGDLPNNVQVFDIISDDQLLTLYRQSKVYAQFSLREGLPNAVCEAMLCECIPVGYNTGGIPIAIGDCGFIIDEGDLDSALQVIKQSLSMGVESGQQARRRIIENFSLPRREKALFLMMSGI